MERKQRMAVSARPGSEGASSQGTSASVNGSPLKHDISQGQDSTVTQDGQAPTNGQQMPGQDGSGQQRSPIALVEEVLQILKTAFPLLILNMEQMVEQIFSRFKPTSEEEIYRFMSIMIGDALQV